MFASEDHIQESTRVKHTAKAEGNALTAWNGSNLQLARCALNVFSHLSVSP